MNDEVKKIVEIKIGFDVDKEEIEYIESDFMKEGLNYKEPVEYTARLIQMALEYFIRTQIGVFCPGCDIELQEEWTFCPKCGYDLDK